MTSPRVAIISKCVQGNRTGRGRARAEGVLRGEGGRVVTSVECASYYVESMVLVQDQRHAASGVGFPGASGPRVGASRGSTGGPIGGDVGTRHQSHYHDVGNTNQNLGNKLGSRPCVRQTDNYRRYEGGNTMKALLGNSNLQWNEPRAPPVASHSDLGYDKHAMRPSQVRVAAARAPRDLAMFDVPVAQVEPGQRFVLAGNLPTSSRDAGVGRRAMHVQEAGSRAAHFESYGAVAQQKASHNGTLSPSMMNKARQETRSAPWDR